MLEVEEKIILSKEEIENMERGISQFPWITEEINNILKKPTVKEFKALLKKIEGSFKQNVENIIKRLENS